MVQLDALTRPVRLSVRALPAGPCTAGEALRRLRASSGVVVLGGRWDAGAVLVATDPICESTGRGDPFSVLDRQPQLVLDDGATDDPQGPVGGGWFGWIGFERTAHALGFYPNVLRLQDGRWYDEALLGLLPDEELDARRERLRRLLLSTERSGPLPYKLGPISASRDRSAHAAAVERCIQHIRAGDVYQANICLRLCGEFAGSAADLGADLFDQVRAPYGGYLDLAGHRVASASPELFLRRHRQAVRSQPIKGTRPRTGAADVAQREARRLAGSQKDRAENVMIVDLMRNDLSRVAATGSVRVPQLLDVVAHPGVWHLESTVTARLAAGCRDTDLLRATFPPGSVSGAPKARALEVIAELEDAPRGVYTGAFGYVSPVAGVELNVAIRTVDIAGGQLTLGVGGGVTVDSTPVQEWWECFDKGRPLLTAVGGRITVADSERPPRDARAAAGVFDTALVHAGEVLERAEHLARLERSIYDLYQRELPAQARAALLRPQSAHDRWQRQRIDVRPDGAVSVTRAPVPQPTPVGTTPGADAVVVAAPAGFGPHKWADRRRQDELEAAHPGKVVVLSAGDGLLESTRANVIAVVDDQIVTAPLDGRILPGVTRTVVLELARDLGVPVALRPPQLSEAQAVAVVGSVTGLRWIRHCAGRSWDDPGELLRELSRRLLARWGAQAALASGRGAR